MDRLGERIDAVVIPVGGGGLLAGMATTLKHLSPEVTVIVSHYTPIVMQCEGNSPCLVYRSKATSGYWLEPVGLVSCTFMECGITQYSLSVLLGT